MNTALRVYCPACEANPGDPCVDNRRSYMKGQGPTIKRPHEARVARLQREAIATSTELVELQAGLIDLTKYLTSEKFATDRSVNIEDVLLRLREAKSKAIDARLEVA